MNCCSNNEEYNFSYSQNRSYEGRKEQEDRKDYEGRKNYEDSKEQENRKDYGGSKEQEDRKNYEDRKDYGGHKEKEIKNKALLEVNLCGKKLKIESNEVEAKKVKIELKKEQSCNFAIEGEELEYCIKIMNFSDIELHNAEFEDKIPDDTVYVKDSFTFDGKKECPEIKHDTIRFKIKELKKKDVAVVTFKVKVL